MLKDNQFIELPQLMAGSFAGFDRLVIPYNILILKKVLQREDNGDIYLICHAKDGPEEKRGTIHFSINDRKKKDLLFFWFRQHIGNNIETIYESNFSFKD